MQLTPKKIIIILILILMVIVAIFTWLSFADTQEAVIKSSDPNAEISIQGVKDNEARNHGRGEVRVRLKFGDYTATAKNGDKETRGLLSLKGGDPANLTLEVAELKTPQKIASAVARSPIVSETAVHYLNPAFGQLDKFVISEGEPSVLNPSLFGLVEVYWITSDRAYVADENGGYGYYSGSEVSSLNLSEASAFTANRQGAFAYVKENKAHVHPSFEGVTSFSVDTNAIEPALALGGEQLLLIYDTGADTEGSRNPAAPQLYNGGRKLDAATNALKDMSVTGATFSPDNKKIALSSDKGDHILNVEDGHLTKLSNAASFYGESFLWLNENELLYFADQTIWRIHAGTQTWQKLARTDESVPTSKAFAVSPNGQNAYFVTDIASGLGLDGAIYVFSLR